MAVSWTPDPTDVNSIPRLYSTCAMEGTGHRVQLSLTSYAEEPLTAAKYIMDYLSDKIAFKVLGIFGQLAKNTDNGPLPPDPGAQAMNVPFKFTLVLKSEAGNLDALVHRTTLLIPSFQAWDRDATQEVGDDLATYMTANSDYNVKFVGVPN